MMALLLCICDMVMVAGPEYESTSSIAIYCSSVVTSAAGAVAPVDEAMGDVTGVDVSIVRILGVFPSAPALVFSTSACVFDLRVIWQGRGGVHYQSFISVFTSVDINVYVHIRAYIRTYTYVHTLDYS